MGKAEKNREMKCRKWCPVGDGKKGYWLDTRIRWLREGDIIRGFKDGKFDESISFEVTSKPYWSKVHQCWDVKTRQLSG